MGYVIATQLRRIGAFVVAIVAIGALSAGLAGQHARAASAETAFFFDSEPGNPTGMGIATTIGPQDIKYLVGTYPNNGDPSWVYFYVYDGQHSWWAEFASPPGTTLGPGAYDGAVWVASRAPNQPGMAILRDGERCDDAVAGSFTVHEFTTTASGGLAAFAASFRQRCASGTAEVFGEVRWNSAAGYTALSVAPPSADLGSAKVMSATGPIAITLTATGTTPLDVASLSLGGAQAADFAIASEDCTAAPVAVGGHCTVNVTATPSAIGMRAASLVVDDNTLRGGRSIPVTVVGIDPVEISPVSLTFGAAALGSSAPTQVISISNTGTVDVIVSTVTVGGDSAADFSVTSETCTAGLVAASSSCSVTVGFKPAVLGLRNAVLTIAGPDPVGSRSVALSGNGIAPPSGIAWGTTYKPGRAYTWVTGNALARTVKSGTQYLHVAYATDRIGSSWAKDAGPYAGVYYIRSTTGSTWSTAKRLNPTRQHATRLGLASAGSRVYAAWVTQTKYYKYSPTAPRVLYVRVNTKHGASTYWKSPIRLTSTSGRVDYPSVAAAGYDVYVAYTDSVTGSVRVAASHDRGVTWKTKTVGSTTLSGASGKAGFPSISVAGSTVAVAWLADGAGGIKARVSTNKGTSWGTATALAPVSNGYLNIAVRGTRVALAWTTDDDVVVRQGTSAAWGDPVVVAGLEPGADPFPYAPVIQLQDPNRVAVAWSEMIDPGASWSTLRWIESADAGATWFEPQTLSTAASSSHRANDGTSVQWPAAGTRYVVWNGWTYGTLNYRLYLRKGTGSPVGPTLAATVWQPSADAPAPMWRDSRTDLPTGP